MTVGHLFNARLILIGSLSFVAMLAGAAALVLVVWPIVPVPSSAEKSHTPVHHTPVHEVNVAVDVDPPSVRQPYPPLSSIDIDAPVAHGNWIRIPSTGIHVPLVMSSSMNDVDVLTALDQGAVLYPNDVLPGSLGNVFVAAHSTGEPWKGAYRFAFLKINQIQPSQYIHLDWNGTRYSYRVTGNEIIIPTRDFRVVSDRPYPTVTLMACWPLWSTSKRMLVHGELTNITKLATTPS